MSCNGLLDADPASKVSAHHGTPGGDLSLVPGGASPNPDVLLALWVLISFIEKVTYHTASDYPATLAFFSDSEVFEVLVIHAGQETLVSHAIWCLKDESPPRRIIVLDDPSQSKNINIPNTAGFCSVSTDGEVSYFL